MKKIFKMCLFVLITSVAILGAAVFLSPSSNLICRAATLDNTHTVNFYSGNNLLYSVEVPDGVSLNEYENYNLVENSALTISDIPITTTRQLGFYSFTDYTIDVDGYHFSTSSQWSGLNYSFSFDEIKADVYFTIRVKSDNIDSQQLGVFSRYFNSSGSLIDLGYSIVLNNKLTSEYQEFTYLFPYVEDYSFCCFNIWNSASSGTLKSYSIDFVSLYTENYKYYNHSYIDKIYNRINSSNIDNVNWSLTSDTSTYDFNTPITQDTNLYGYDGYYHNVNFYSENNLLYSIEVPNGVSLNDLQNSNLLQNSFFSEYDENLGSSYTGTGYYFDYWRGTRAETTVSYDNGCLVVSGGNASSGILQTLTGYDNLNTFAGKTFYAIVKINSIDGKTALRVRNTTNWLDYAISNISSPGIYTITGVFPNDFNYTPVVYLSADQPFNEFSVEWVDFKLTNSYSSYFNILYVNKLYRNTNNLTSNDNILWSTTQSTGQFDFSQPITKDTNIYGYEELEFNNNAQELEAEVSYQPSYYLLEKAIDNIEYIHYKGSLFFNVIVDTNKFSGNLATYGLNFFDINSTILLSDFTAATSTTQTKNFNSISISNTGKVLAQDYSDLPLNLAVYGVEGQSNVVKITYYLNMGNSLYQFKVSPNVGKVCLSFTTSAISYNNGFVYNDYEFYDFYNGTEINDMNSNTNYFLQFSSLSPNFLDNYQALIDIYQGNKNYLSFNYDYSLFNNSNYLTITTQGQINDTDKITSVQDDGIIGNQMYIEFANTYLNYEFGFKFSQFDVIVRKPVARVDNSLVIFNFGYNNFLSAVTQTKYELRRGYQYYDVIYNGRLENSKMIVIDNEYVRNSLFDEYIFLSFISDGSVTSTVDIVDGKIGTYLGFDFNFVYYTQPLIAGNASYDLMQYRPEYMDGTPSLVPLNIPFTAWIYNAFLWLIFDCPLISDLLGLLYLNSFMGALLNILNIYMTSGIGEFIMACLCFVIFWAILKSLMPALVGAGRSIYSNTQFAYNRRQKKQEKLNFKNDKKELKYQNKVSTVKRTAKYANKIDSLRNKQSDKLYKKLKRK